MTQETDTPNGAEKQAIVARLSKARVYRRDQAYKAGFTEGNRWAAEDASWREIKTYAAYTDDDVRVVATAVGQWNQTILEFQGIFFAPIEDYDRFDVDYEGTPATMGAPAFRRSTDTTEETGADDWIVDPFKCENYWRGWLNGVRSVFNLVIGDLEPEAPSDSRTVTPGQWVRHPAFGVGMVALSTPTATDEELVVRFDAVGVKILSATIAPLEPLGAADVAVARAHQAEADDATKNEQAREIDPDDIPF